MRTVCPLLPGHPTSYTIPNSGTSTGQACRSGPFRLPSEFVGLLQSRTFMVRLTIGMPMGSGPTRPRLGRGREGQSPANAGGHTRPRKTARTDSSGLDIIELLV